MPLGGYKKKKDEEDKKAEIKFYKKWFSFKPTQSLTFDVASEKDAHYSDIYETFLEEYKSGYQGIGTTALQLPNQITTKCEFITASTKEFVPYMTGIWSVGSKA